MGNNVEIRRYFHKFKAKPVKSDGHHFGSTAEYNFGLHLELEKKNGNVVFYLRQVPFHLPGGVKYVVDYMVFNHDGTINFIDVKGVETKEFITKKKIVEALYPIEIKVVKKTKRGFE